MGLRDRAAEAASKAGVRIRLLGGRLANKLNLRPSGEGGGKR